MMLKTKLEYFHWSGYLVLMLVFGGAFNVYAAPKNPVLDGLYIPVSGSAQSQEVGITSPEQIGTYSIRLKRVGWQNLSAVAKKMTLKSLDLTGVFHGIAVDLHPSGFPLLDHVLGNDSRSGAFYTGRDALDPATVEVEPCNDGFIVRAEERLNFVSATGQFETLNTDYENTLFLDATLNLCTGQNDFTLITQDGGLCFGDGMAC